MLSLLLASCSTSKHSTFLVGTYTESSSQGINVIQFDTDSKAISIQNLIPEIENPSFVVTNKAKTIMVAVEETASEKGGKVTSYSYNSTSNKFQKLNSLFTKGNHPCTVTFSPDEKYVIVGNYSGGNLSVFPINQQGNLSENSQFILYEGKSVNAERQEKPHVHSVVFHPKDSFLFVADLGRDAIEMIPFDSNSRTFLQTEKAISTKVESGSGPRHLLFNTTGNTLYVTYELTNEIGVFKFENNQLQYQQTIALTKTPTKSGSAAELRLSDDGNYLYATVRGNDNQLVIMKVNQDKNLEVIQNIATGKAPRNFILTKDQKNILVANQDSNKITVFDRNTKSGLLSPTSSEIAIPKPVYLFKF